MSHGLRQETFDEQIDRLIAENPDALELQAYKVESDMSQAPDYRKHQLKLYDALIAKHPKVGWLSLNRLRISCTGSPAIDQGEFMPPEFRAPREGWLTTSELKQAVRAAEIAERQEPDNAFCDYMRAAFLFGLKRPEDALKAMHDGAGKTRFDDGMLRQGQNLDKVFGYLEPRLWEDRIVSQAALLFPHYAIMRSSNRAAIWQGTLAERKGDHARALQIYGDQMKLAALMRRDSTTLIEMLVAQSLQKNAWTGITRKASDEESYAPSSGSAEDAKERRQRLLQEGADAFGAYARRHGRNDLAGLALSELHGFDGLRLGKLISSEQSEYIFGTHRREDAIRVIQLRWIGSTVLAGLLIWIPIFVLLALPTLRSKHDAGMNPALQPIDLAASSCLVGATWLVTLFLALNRGILDSDYSWLAATNEMNEVNQGAYESMVAYFQILLTWLPLGLAILSGLFAAFWRSRKNSATPARPWPLPWIIVTYVLVLAALAWVARLWYAWSTNDQLMDATSYLTLLLFVPLAGGVLFCLKRLHRSRPETILYGLVWARGTLGVLILIASLVYVAAGLAALPIRQRLDTQMTKFIQKGEIAIMREIADREDQARR